MRIAIITDIHGNLPALEAVLNDLSSQPFDQLVIAGDTINCLPHSKTCWETVRSLDALVLQGNHEELIGNLSVLQDQNPVFSSERYKPAQWCAAQFSNAERAAMLSLPTEARFEDLYITHAAPNKLSVSVAADTPAETLHELFADVPQGMIVRGHNHKWLERRFGHQMVLTVNSCGIPLDGEQGAPYAILSKGKTWNLEKRHVPYDKTALLAAINTPDYLEGNGPLGLIFRQEVVTARDELARFFQRFLPAIDAGHIGLAKAVRQYLEPKG